MADASTLTSAQLANLAELTAHDPRAQGFAFVGYGVQAPCGRYQRGNGVDLTDDVFFAALWTERRIALRKAGLLPGDAWVIEAWDNGALRFVRPAA